MKFYLAEWGSGPDDVGKVRSTLQEAINDLIAKGFDVSNLKDMGAFGILFDDEQDISVSVIMV